MATRPERVIASSSRVSVSTLFQPQHPRTLMLGEICVCVSPSGSRQLQVSVPGRPLSRISDRNPAPLPWSSGARSKREPSERIDRQPIDARTDQSIPEYRVVIDVKAIDHPDARNIDIGNVKLPSDGARRLTTGVVLRGTKSLLTHCWRGVDSNFRFGGALSLITNSAALAGPPNSAVSGGSLNGPLQPRSVGGRQPVRQRRPAASRSSLC